ncbi:MAG TPA: ArdC family protein [Pyrinomonadaceae bacterium]|nr:ArdC family protein [Pyrinomonadaceae bacterium]
MTETTRWSQLLIEAVQKPGLICEAFHAFHGYSMGNRMLALDQCRMRNLEPGPICTYRGWQEKRRQVRKGEKAIVLCRPLTRTFENELGEQETIITGFVESPFGSFYPKRPESRSSFRPHLPGIAAALSPRLIFMKFHSPSLMETRSDMHVVARSPSVP